MRVVIAEDLLLLREGMVHLLEENGFTVAAAVDNAPDLLNAVATHQPDAALVDVRLPPSYRDEGLRTAIEIRKLHANVGVLIVSQYVEPVYARELLADTSGSVGYLLKDRVGDVRTFLDAIRQVAGGGTVLDPEVVSQLITSHTQDSPITTLTPREREVLALMAEGLSNAAIARALFVTERAVSKHINNILTKLGLPPSDDDHRRVRAVLTYLRSASDAP